MGLVAADPSGQVFAPAGTPGVRIPHAATGRTGGSSQPAPMSCTRRRLRPRRSSFRIAERALRRVLDLGAGPESRRSRAPGASCLGCRYPAARSARRIQPPAGGDRNLTVVEGDPTGRRRTTFDRVVIHPPYVPASQRSTYSPRAMTAGDHPALFKTAEISAPAGVLPSRSRRTVRVTPSSSAFATGWSRMRSRYALDCSAGPLNFLAAELQRHTSLKAAASGSSCGKNRGEAHAVHDGLIERHDARDQSRAGSIRAKAIAGGI
jgi:hypothetical protein